MDYNSKELPKENPSNSSSKNEENEKLSEKREDKKDSSFSDNIGFNKLFTLDEYNQINSDNLNKKETVQTNINKEEDLKNKLSIDLSHVNKKILHNFLNEDLIDAIDKSLDDPIDNHKISDISNNENETNYSQNNLSNDNDIFNNLSNMNNNLNFYPQNINSIHNSISFFPKINNKNEEMNINNKNYNIIQNVNNKEENNKDIKKLVDYFGNNNPLDAPVYIPQKFKSLKFNQKPNKIESNDTNHNNLDNNNNKENNNDSDKKEEQYKKPFEIREGDWTCEFCYNLNFAFRTRCNRCGLIKDFMQINNNLSLNNNNNDNFPDYQKYKPSNLYLGNNANNFFQFLNSIDLSNTPLFSPNTSNYP